MSATSLRLGTRGSLLARTQSERVAEAMHKVHPGLVIDVVTVATTGDRLTDIPLAESGGKGLFTKELELALLANEIDFAVHSLKDVPVTQPLVDQTDLIIAAVPMREDARDVLVSRSAKSLAELAKGADVGTGSLRRRCQVLQLRPDLKVEALRGNIDTRLRKASGGQHDAIILAMAGLNRIGRFEADWMFPIDFAEVLPAAGQGALALQCRKSDQRTAEILAKINDPRAFAAAQAERAVVQGLNGDCQSPIAAHATISGNELTLTAAVGLVKGDPPVKRAKAAGPAEHWRSTVDWVVGQLRSQEPMI